MANLRPRRGLTDPGAIPRGRRTHAKQPIRASTATPKDAAMTTEFRPEDYSPRQLVTGKELDRIAATPGEQLTSEEVGHHAYANVNHFINPGIGWLRMAVHGGDEAKAANERALISDRDVLALLAVVASKLPGDSETNIAVLTEKLEAHLHPILDQYSKNALPLIDTDAPFLAWAGEVEKYHASLI